eukprot:SAG31_NODE_432_length_15773_cov_7.563892_4_plen_77_part_00
MRLEPSVIFRGKLLLVNCAYLLSQTSSRTPLLIPVPNSSADVGDMRDAWMPSPSCCDFRKYEFLGRLMVWARRTNL